MKDLGELSKRALPLPLIYPGKDCSLTNICAFQFQECDRVATVDKRKSSAVHIGFISLSDSCSYFYLDWPIVII